MNKQLLTVLIATLKYGKLDTVVIITIFIILWSILEYWQELYPCEVKPLNFKSKDRALCLDFVKHNLG